MRRQNSLTSAESDVCRPIPNSWWLTQIVRSRASWTADKEPRFACRAADSSSCLRGRGLTWSGLWPSAGADGRYLGVSRIMGPARARAPLAVPGTGPGEVAVPEAFADLPTPLVADACLRCDVPLRVADSGIRAVVAGQRIAGRVLPVRHNGSVDVFLE